MTYNNQWLRLPAIGLVIAACALSGCGSSNNNSTPSDDAGSTKGTGGKGGSAGKGAAGKSGTGGKTGTAGKDAGAAEDDAGGGTGGTGGSGSTACEKNGSDKCFTCDAPATDQQFLNRCTTATCTAYDNSKLTKLVNGKLPDLPN